MACCLTAPSHYLTPYWLAINKVLWYSFQGNVYWNTQDTNPQVVFEIDSFEITAISPQLALRRWPNVGPTSTLTLGQRRLTNVGPTWICQLAQRLHANVGPTLCQHRPNVGTLTLGPRWHNVMPKVVCQRCTNIGPTEAALLAFCEGNPSVTDRSPVEQTVEMSNQWFETPMWSTSM